MPRKLPNHVGARRPHWHNQDLLLWPFACSALDTEFDIQHVRVRLGHCNGERNLLSALWRAGLGCERGGVRKHQKKYGRCGKETTLQLASILLFFTHRHVFMNVTTKLQFNLKRQSNPQITYRSL